jgi:hypothetical protein
MGASIEVQLMDDSWLIGKIVGKGFGKDALRHVVVMIVFEYEEEGHRFRDILPWGEPTGVIWREPQKAAS